MPHDDDPRFEPGGELYDLLESAPAGVDAPITGARTVFEEGRWIHGARHLQVLGYEDYVAVSRSGSAAQNNTADSVVDDVYVGRYDATQSRFDPAIVLHGCGGIGGSGASVFSDSDWPGDALMGEVAGATHLWMYDHHSLIDVDLTRVAVVSTQRCGNCWDAHSAERDCDYCGELVYDGDHVFVEQLWGTKIAVVGFDPATGTSTSSVVLDADAGVVEVAGQVWTASPSQGLIRWDPRSGATITRLPVTPGMSVAKGSLQTDGLFFAGGHFWSETDGPSGELALLDPSLATVSRVGINDLVAAYATDDRIYYEVYSHGSDATVGVIDATSATIIETVTMHSFVYVDENGVASGAFLPALQTDPRGVWFVMPDAWRSGTTRSGVDWPGPYGEWPVYRWQVTSS